MVVWTRINNDLTLDVYRIFIGNIEKKKACNEFNKQCLLIKTILSVGSGQAYNRCSCKKVKLCD